MVEKEEAGGGISEEEAAQYDRQIRLWGLEAQKRLRASRVLLVGMKGLGAEIAKNLILAGVKGLTMLDHEQVSPEDPGAQFLIRTGSVGRNRAEASLERAQNLNPMVDVKVDTEDIEKKPESFFTQFDAVCLTCCSRDVIVKVDQICHKNSIKFFTGDVFGYHGYTFANLGEHEFVEEKTKIAKVSQGVEDGPDTKRAKLDSSETTMVKKKVVFCPVKEALEVDWSSEKAKAALKRTTSDYFLLQGPVSAGPSSQQLLLLRWHEGEWDCRVPWPQVNSRLGKPRRCQLQHSRLYSLSPSFRRHLQARKTEVIGPVQNISCDEGGGADVLLPITSSCSTRGAGWLSLFQHCSGCLSSQACQLP
ncbi:PREDICTED: SUMO-activating enzyme subunit 1 isoform X1 [Mandrillus leucophaeus]|uniref:SUMO-activating enzyme subunit 1 isoform X1 n=1 Tax=Mandrillus leucophaeus TaxID=9568 RepID=UPI0005F4FCD2|nr:PREDICTED: SUMO-activating enzyme subunit 1 isoform X1 [Mandrillus leucophaeus]